MIIKQMEKKESIKFLTNELLNLYSYFNNNVTIDENLLRQVNSLSEDLEVYTNLTTTQFQEALKIGRRDCQDTFKPSIKLIIQWVSTYMIRFNKYNSVVHQYPGPGVDPNKKYNINYSLEQRKAWIISSYRQYNENNKDMAKFYDFGGVTYEAIYKHHNYGLTKDQKEFCFKMAKKLDNSIMIGGLLSLVKSQDEFISNPSACAYACKIFFDQFDTESDLRQELMYFDNVSKDHFVAAYEKTPLLVNYFQKKNENNFPISIS